MTEMLRDLRLLSSALGFLAVAMRQENLAIGGAERATKIAALIEEFCLSSVEDGQNKIMNQTLTTAQSTKTVGKTSLSGSWACEHLPGHTLLRVPANNREGAPSVVEIHAGEAQTARAVAENIVDAVNDNARKNALIAELAACLELCLESEGLPWEAEHDAEIVLGRARGELA